MLKRVELLLKCVLRATDGEVGRVTDAYFDDQHWTVRYLVADTGLWLGWHVLISPQSIGELDWDARTITVGLTRDQVEHSPRADLQHPLSRLYESEFYTHFGYPPYWDAPPAWGLDLPPLAPGDAAAAMPPGAPSSEYPGDPGPGAADYLPASPDPPVASAADAHVRSWREVKGFHIRARDGEVGHVDDLFVDDETWAIRFIELDTSNWIGGQSVLVPRGTLGDVDWPAGLIHVSLTREQVQRSPRVDEAHLTGAFEQELEAYYRR